MIQRTLPVPFPKTALLIRNLVDRVIRTGEPVKLVPTRPANLPEISLTMLVKNEWETMVESVQSLMPMPSEIIIGIDKTTDEPISFAYREAFLTKGKDTFRKFFDSFLKEGRLATMDEVADFIGVSKSSLEKRIDKYLANGKPTYLAAQKCLEIVGSGKIIEIDFNDHFSNARNILLEQCTKEICMFVDGHEFLSNTNVLMNAMVIADAEMPGWKVFGIMIDMIDSPIREKNRQVRIWRNSPNVRFTRGVHNRLHFPEGELDNKVYPTVEDSTLIHNRPGWLALFREPQRQRMVSHHMGGKEDGSSLYYDGLGYQRAREWDKAIECFQKYLEISPPGPESAVVCWYLGRCLGDGKGEYEKAFQWYLKGIERCPDAAFCHLAAAQHKLRVEEAEPVDHEQVKTRLLTEALAYAHFAEASVYPGGTIAVPSYCYTWDVQLIKAEILRRLTRYGEAAMALEKSLQYDMDTQRSAEAEAAMYEMRRLNVETMNAALRLSKKDGNQHVYIVDPSKEYGLVPFREAESIGAKVIASEMFEAQRFFESDTIWIEGIIDVLPQVSVMMKDDRRIIVRIHPNDVYDERFTAINWEGIDECLCSCMETINRAAIKWDLPDSLVKRFKEVPVIQVPTMASLTSQDSNSVIVGLGNGDEWCLPMLVELAQRNPELKITVTGPIADEMVYDRVSEACLGLDINNLHFTGKLHPSEIESLLASGSAYISFNPETDRLVAVACKYLMKIFSYGFYSSPLCQVFNFYGVHHLENQLKGNSANLKQDQESLYLESSQEIHRALFGK